MKIRCAKRSFTLIELIITITVMGIVLIPLGMMSLEFTREIVYSRDSGVAEGLIKIDMAKMNNLINDSPADPTIAVGYDNTTTNYDSLGYPYGLRRTITAGPSATLRQAQVRVYPGTDTAQPPLANAITYLANIPFGPGSGTGAVGTIQANSLVVSGGSISAKNLINVTLQNTDTANAITIQQMTISFTGAGGINLQKVTIGGTDVFSGNASSGDTINLSPTFTLSANTSYSSPTFLQFNKNLTSVASLVFIMSDGSVSTDYSW